MDNRPSHKNVPKWSILILIILVSLTGLGGGYWLYQQSIGRAVYSTTISFMKQIADHAQLNIINQMNTKWEYINSILERIRLTRDGRLENVLYDLGAGAAATDFDKMYLITDEGLVYSSSYLETRLEDMPWKEIYQEASGNFVMRHSENSREQWGEYLVYGIRLEEPISCGERSITGAVGLLPISEIDSQMRLESFDGQGVAVVMQPDGEIITASQQYSSSGVTQNFLTTLEKARFVRGTSLKACGEAIGRGESVFAEYTLGQDKFYALFQPLRRQGGNDWYLVVRVSTQVTESQVRTLIFRSLPFFFILGILILVVTFFVYHNINAARIARASEQAKTAFLANMSHEIRTPLNGIVGLHYLMRENLDDKDKLVRYLKKAEISAEFLKSIITDVLDMSKIESGQLEIYESGLDLSSVVGEIEVLIGIQADEKKLRFQVDLERMTQPLVVGDAVRIKQILMNFLGNSLKFTPEGGELSLTVSQTVAGDTASTVFVVADTGCGMSPEFLARIWKPFEQERRAASQNGTGLGTTLSKTLAEKMGGTISVESRQGEGTTFTVVLPLAVTDHVTVQNSPLKNEMKESGLKGKHILVAEDNEINRMIVVSILEEQGCELVEAADGQEAVNIFLQSRPHFFDLILMDIQMPELNGYEAAEQIRRLPRPDGQTVPVFAMTANAFREDVDKAISCGMNDVITKPLDIGLLLDKIKNLPEREEL
ncbi:ATP-binding protein [Hungatella hathewayi]|uniref:ATP-binding protein n=1 Tax=Hungatella hathewayi TaxID=154046 RepID=UPI0035638FED